MSYSWRAQRRSIPDNDEPRHPSFLRRADPERETIVDENFGRPTSPCVHKPEYGTSSNGGKPRRSMFPFVLAKLRIAKRQHCLLTSLAVATAVLLGLVVLNVAYNRVSTIASQVATLDGEVDRLTRSNTWLRTELDRARKTIIDVKTHCEDQYVNLSARTDAGFDNLDRQVAIPDDLSLVIGATLAGEVMDPRDFAELSELGQVLIEVNRMIYHEQLKLGVQIDDMDDKMGENFTELRSDIVGVHNDITDVTNGIQSLKTSVDIRGAETEEKIRDIVVARTETEHAEIRALCKQAPGGFGWYNNHNLNHLCQKHPSTHCRAMYMDRK